MEIDLLRNYPKANRDLAARAEKTDIDRAIAREFGKDFFDGERRHGYGGFRYNPKYWSNVVPDFKNHYFLGEGDHVLDVGCAKGFMLYDFKRLIPGIYVSGVDISEYAIENAHPEVRKDVEVGDARELPFEDDSVDLAISINTIHNLDLEGCAMALREIQRVAMNAFVVVDAFRTPEEEQRMIDWNLTARTIMHVDEWKRFFRHVGYTGDYYWFTP